MPFLIFLKIIFPGSFSPELYILPLYGESIPGRLIKYPVIFGETASDSHQDFSQTAPPRSVTAVCPVMVKLSVLLQNCVPCRDKDIPQIIMLFKFCSNGLHHDIKFYIEPVTPPWINAAFGNLLCLERRFYFTDNFRIFGP